MKIVLLLVLISFLRIPLGFTQVVSPLDTLCGRLEKSPDKVAYYIGGRKQLIKDMSLYSFIPITDKATKYPVRVKLLICPDGRFTISELNNEEVAHYEALKIETERVIKLMKGFVPAEKNGKRVKSEYWIQLYFKPKKKMGELSFLVDIPAEN